MTTKPWVKRIIHRSPYFEKIARDYRTRLDHRNRSDWSFSPKSDLWSKVINTEEAEELSGIQTKISHLTCSNQVLVIGGKTTGGADDIFFLDPMDGYQLLASILQSAPTGCELLFYSPHPFWANLFDSRYRWIPTWEDLYWIFHFDPEWRIVQYSASFDPSGRYFFIAQKYPEGRRLCTNADLARKTFHVFYFRVGGDLTLGRSNYALSAHLCNAIRRTGASVYAHDFTDVESLREVKPEDVLIGHVGPWVKEAAKKGFQNIILFNPANRWYPTRNSPIFESNATIAEQVHLAKSVIAQSGVYWRTTAEYPEPMKWRWIDLGIDTNLFPFIKREFNPPGKRQFLFFHLYDSLQKGSDIAEEIIRAKPGDNFTWLGGATIKKTHNLRVFPQMLNTSERFRQEVGNCDFILTPSREDAQPGTVVEAAALGLIPATTYTSGYSISFPFLVEPNKVELWGQVVDYLQAVDNSVLLEVQDFIQHYLRSFHDWYLIEAEILFYLRETLTGV